MLPPLLENQVHVWAWNLDLAPQPSEWEILGAEETLRARRFVFPQDRDRYVRAHSAMRTLLGRYAGILPAEIFFSANAHGKPGIAVSHNANRLRFNLTHSAGIGALAVSRDYDIGIDVEQMRPMDQEVAEHHFSPVELAALQRLPAEQWLAGFYRCWTSKEALLKGEGLGLNLPLDGFDVEADPQRPATLLARRNADIAPEWLLVELSPAQDTIGTLAILDPARKFAPASLHCFALSG